MQYKSTRGGESGLSFEKILISAYASDGGLYVPDEIPQLLPETLLEWEDFTYEDVCTKVVHLYSGVDVSIIAEMTKASFKEFNHGLDPPVPVIEMESGLFLLDLSLGPTLAFKDCGQQILAKLLDYFLGRTGKKANVLIDTSGDTGPSAIAAVKNCLNVEIFCLYPFGRVSEVQELQMITVRERNVHIYRTTGNSDEQASVIKQICNDKEFVSKYNICSMNSINWVRIAVQSSYYIWIYLQLRKKYKQTISTENIFNFNQFKINVCIPSGAFGNALAAYISTLMGIPINKILCATNANDVVHRTLAFGDMNMTENIKTISPAMDIQFAYQLERLLFYIFDEDTVKLKDVMNEIDLQYQYQINPPRVNLENHHLRKIQEIFSSYSVTDEQTRATMRYYKENYNIFLCPHSAIGVYAATTHFTTHTGISIDPMHPNTSGTSQGNVIPPLIPTVCILTANAAKFEATVKDATGELPPLPDSVRRLKTLPHRYVWLRKAGDYAGEPQGLAEDAGEAALSTEAGSGEEEREYAWRERWMDKIRSDICFFNIE